MGLLRPLIMFHVSRSRPLIAVVKQCARLGMAMLLLVASAPAGTGVAYARSITRDSLGPYKDKVLTIPSVYFVTILVRAVLPTCVAAHSLCGRQQPHCDGSMTETCWLGAAPALAQQSAWRSDRERFSLVQAAWLTLIAVCTLFEVYTLIAVYTLCCRWWTTRASSAGCLSCRALRSIELGVLS